MNTKLKDLIGRIETWPVEAQEEAAELLLALEQEYAEPYGFPPKTVPRSTAALKTCVRDGLRLTNRCRRHSVAIDSHEGSIHPDGAG